MTVKVDYFFANIVPIGVMDKIGGLIFRCFVHVVKIMPIYFKKFIFVLTLF